MNYIILGSIIGLIVLVSFGIIVFALMDHDDNLRYDQNVNSTSCSYLKNFITEEEQKYFKHPWYDRAVKKVNSSECNKDITESSKSTMDDLYDSWEKQK